MIEIAPHIVVDPKIRFGKPVIRGTRVPVHIIIAKLAGGMTQKEIGEEYEVTLEDIKAALAYAAKMIEQQEVRVFA